MILDNFWLSLPIVMFLSNNADTLSSLSMSLTSHKYNPLSISKSTQSFKSHVSTCTNIPYALCDNSYKEIDSNCEICENSACNDHIARFQNHLTPYFISLNDHYRYSKFPLVMGKRTASMSSLPKVTKPPGVPNYSRPNSPATFQYWDETNPNFIHRLTDFPSLIPKLKFS